MFKDPYQVLYLFDSATTAIVEIKMKHAVSDDRSKMYKWFLYDKENDMLLPLVYKDRKIENESEYRVFEDSLLIFDTAKAVYTKKNLKLELRTIDPALPLDKKLKESVNDYLIFLQFRENKF